MEFDIERNNEYESWFPESDGWEDEIRKLATVVNLKSEESEKEEEEDSILLEDENEIDYSEDSNNNSSNSDGE